MHRRVIEYFHGRKRRLKRIQLYISRKLLSLFFFFFPSFFLFFSFISFFFFVISVVFHAVISEIVRQKDRYHRDGNKLVMLIIRRQVVKNMFLIEQIPILKIITIFHISFYLCPNRNAQMFATYHITYIHHYKTNCYYILFPIC